MSEQADWVDVGVAVDKFKQLLRAEKRVRKLKDELSSMLAALSDDEVLNYNSRINELQGEKNP